MKKTVAFILDEKLIAILKIRAKEANTTVSRYVGKIIEEKLK